MAERGEGAFRDRRREDAFNSPWWNAYLLICTYQECMIAYYAPKEWGYELHGLTPAHVNEEHHKWIWREERAYREDGIEIIYVDVEEVAQ